MGSDLFVFQLEQSFSLAKMYLSQINSQLSITIENDQDYKAVKKRIDKVSSTKSVLKNNNFKIKGLINWNKYKIDIRQQLKDILISIVLGLQAKKDEDIIFLVNSILRQ